MSAISEVIVLKDNEIQRLRSENQGLRRALVKAERELEGLWDRVEEARRLLDTDDDEEAPKENP